MRNLLTLLPLVLSIGCASSGANRADQDMIIKEFYATVHSVKSVELSSDVGTGFLVGAGIGALDSSDGDSGDIIVGTMVGALFGGLFSMLAEGDRQAYEYQLYSAAEGNFSLVQQKSLTEQTGCVRVRVAQKTSISAAPMAYCS
jgi:hypothetical protein